MPKMLLAVAVLMLALIAPASAPAAAKPTLLNYYEGPCQKRVREARKIPLFNDARVAWERQHAGDVVAAEFHAALRACPPVAKWDWDSMVISGTETLGR